MRLVDSHCHIDGEAFAGDLDAVIARARSAGVERMVVIGGIGMAETHDFVYATAGIHPHEASQADEASLARIGELLGHPKVVGLGEVGLDYHYDFSPREVQREAFVRQLRIARGRKPVVIHTREAWADTMALLREHWRGDGVFHCFTGGPAEAREALDFGFHLSFGGIVTFPKAHEIRAAAALTPDDRLLIETDAPYLAPAPHRGKRNEPAFVVETARKLAEIRGVSPERIGELTTANFERLFGVV